MIPSRYYKYIAVGSPILIAITTSSLNVLMGHWMLTKTGFVWCIIVSLLTAFVIMVSIYANIIMYNEFRKLIIQLSKPREIDITRNDIKKIHNACTKLDKYGISYKIDFTNKKIDVELPMATYTRMSISGNLDPNIYYHIKGTDVVLHTGENE